MISTVEPFLIRGLDTAYGAFVVGGPRSDPRRSVVPLLNLTEDPLTGADALAAASMSLCTRYAPMVFGSTCRAIAHMKPTSSRAMAVITIGAFLPRASMRRYRPHKRTCAFHAISRCQEPFWRENTF